MKFKRSEKMRLMIDSLYEHAASLERGEVLTHEVVRDVLGCERHTEHWAHCVNQVRRRLQSERGIATWHERNVGYRLLTVTQQIADLPRWRAARAHRQERRARKSLDAIPAAALSPHQQRLRLAQIDAIKASEKQMWHQQRMHALIAKEAKEKKPRRIPFVTVETGNAADAV